MSEPYAVAWSPTACRQLTRLPDRVGPAVVEFVYGIDDDARTVTIRIIRHRSDVYRRWA